MYTAKVNISNGTKVEREFATKRLADQWAERIGTRGLHVPQGKNTTVYYAPSKIQMVRITYVDLSHEPGGI